MLEFTMEDLFNQIFSISEQLKKMQLMSDELNDFFAHETETETGKQLVLAMYEKNKVASDILSDYLFSVCEMTNGIMAHEKEFVKGEKNE